VLDCENQDSARKSLCDLFGCGSEDLVSFFQRTDFEGMYEDHSSRYPFPEFVHSEAVSAFGPHKEVRTVCWFHLTSAFPECDFSEGLLPLDKAIHPIWDALLRVFESTQHHANLCAMRENNVQDHLYNLKMSDPLHWGPHAVLVRESAFYPDAIGAHDYLYLPEIIEDICNGYRNEYRIAIHEEVVAALRPCIVKFRSCHGIHPGCIEAALCYVSHGIKGEELSDDINMCFYGEGRTIPAADILKVEYVKRP